MWTETEIGYQLRLAEVIMIYAALKEYISYCKYCSGG